MVLILLLTPISGCFGGDDSRVDAGDLKVDVESMSAGFFQNLELTASSKMSVYLPFLIKDPASGFPYSAVAASFPHRWAQSLISDVQDFLSSPEVPWEDQTVGLRPGRFGLTTDNIQVRRDAARKSAAPPPKP